MIMIVKYTLRQGKPNPLESGQRLSPLSSLTGHELDLDLGFTSQVYLDIITMEARDMLCLVSELF